ncbi:hypothetical protein DPMN_140737 [Dreissena polymorpha]|uniref:Uncharacterized protein n=1 Tax=Dreissena polymorpha TaxID=45954 RepID=A0A9D4GBG2_DREPO|nr:hypothetical protein DPMN_140737 [Dreissena polymorpha]
MTSCRSTGGVGPGNEWMSKCSAKKFERKRNSLLFHKYGYIAFPRMIAADEFEPFLTQVEGPQTALQAQYTRFSPWRSEFNPRYHIQADVDDPRPLVDYPKALLKVRGSLLLYWRFEYIPMGPEWTQGTDLKTRTSSDMPAEGTVNSEQL